MRHKILVLHGNRQTGDLLRSRMDKLRKALRRDLQWEMVAPDAPHLYSAEDVIVDEDLADDAAGDEDSWQRTWWHRNGNVYQGLEESIFVLLDAWNRGGGDFIGILGFSQGSRLAHILAVLHNVTNGSAFSGLEFVIHVSGYGDCAMPDNLSTYIRDTWGMQLSRLDLEKISLSLPSMHVMGERDTLIPPTSSVALMRYYEKPVAYTHPGGHHVPVKAADVQKYLQFFMNVNSNRSLSTVPTNSTILEETHSNSIQPDDEHAQTQIDEVAALSLIFPNEFRLLSESTQLDPSDSLTDDYSQDSRTYQHPIRYSILLQQQQDCNHEEERLWPPKQISIGIQYPHNYPDVSPHVRLIHDMNYLEFSMQQSEALMNVLRRAMAEEIGMPCVMGMVYAAREFFESGGWISATSGNGECQMPAHVADESDHSEEMEEVAVNPTGSTILKSSSAKRIAECNEKGLEIAYGLLGQTHSDDVGVVNGEKAASETSLGKGGSWKYTIGAWELYLVGAFVIFDLAKIVSTYVNRPRW